MLINSNNSYRFTFLDNSLPFYTEDKRDKAVGFVLLFRCLVLGHSQSLFLSLDFMGDEMALLVT